MTTLAKKSFSFTFDPSVGANQNMRLDIETQQADGSFSGKLLSNGTSYAVSGALSALGRIDFTAYEGQISTSFVADLHLQHNKDLWMAGWFRDYHGRSVRGGFPRMAPFYAVEIRLIQ
ncbi:MAG TPA: hypothetical protein VFK04_12755 [Gemmatimonadaceae bacterium]|nr:hypothetical protein [Gemmatimonadaceae bacterium]